MASRGSVENRERLREIGRLGGVAMKAKAPAGYYREIRKAGRQRAVPSVPVDANAVVSTLDAFLSDVKRT